MKKAAYSCAYVPAEWIAAHRLQPVRVQPSSRAADAVGEREGVCHYLRWFVNTVSQAAHTHTGAIAPGPCGIAADAVVVTTVCDQMRRSPELISLFSGVPVFLMHVPATWQSPASMKYYIDELVRLGDFLVGIGGVKPSDDELAAVMLEYEQKRQARGDNDEKTGGVPLAIVGGELTGDDSAIADIVRRCGGRIALDATDFGQRTIPGRFDRRNIRKSPLIELASAYFGAIPHAFCRPNSELFRYLRREIDAHGIRGIIFRRYQWCDIWNAELPRLREWAGVPVLDLDGAEDGHETARLTGRVQAFMEMLR